MADKAMYLSDLMKPSPKMLGSGLAERAGTAMQDRGYKLYVDEMKAQGVTPLGYDEWMKQKNS